MIELRDGIIASGQDTMCFHFIEGAVITLFDAEKNNGDALFVKIKDGLCTKIDSERIADKLSAVIEMHTASKVRMKVIGTLREIEAIKPIFRLLGIEPLAYHELAHGVDTQHEVYFYPNSGRARVSKTNHATIVTESHIKVLIVDDSRTMRALLKQIFSQDQSIQVVGEASHPDQVMDLIKKTRPHAMTLDLHMPGMDGVTLLRKVLPIEPIPTVVVSAIGMEEGSMVLDALESGAIDYIQKPSFDQLPLIGPELISKIKAAAISRVTLRHTARTRVDALVKRSIQPQSNFGNHVVVIGSSTGGTEALRVFMENLPESIPPVLIVQHIPAVFSEAFAMRMNTLFPFEVNEAKNGDEVRPGRVLIAPGGKHMGVRKAIGKAYLYEVFISDAPPVNRHRPSVDFLFETVESVIGKKALSVILTGMGGDGAQGMLKLRQKGCHTIAQDEATCVVFGMPKEAIRLGAAERIMPLADIAAQIMRWTSEP